MIEVFAPECVVCKYYKWYLAINLNFPKKNSFNDDKGDDGGSPSCFSVNGNEKNVVKFQCYRAPDNEIPLAKFTKYKQWAILNQEFDTEACTDSNALVTRFDAYASKVRFNSTTFGIPDSHYYSCPKSGKLR